MNASFSPDGDKILVLAGQDVILVDAPSLSEAEQTELADFAEIVGGLSLQDGAQLAVTENRYQRLRALQDKYSRPANGAEGRLAAIIRWFFADPENRPISPFVH
jgi:hypothetical protein